MRALSFFKVLIAFFLLNTALSFNAAAQRDVIITQAKEEIRCRILDETPTRFIYAYVGPKGDILRNEIFKNLVSDFKYNKYDSDLPLATSKKGKSKKRKKSQDIALATNDVTSSDAPKEEAVKKQKATDDKLTEEEPSKKSKKEVKKESEEKATAVEKVMKQEKEVELQEKPEKKSKKERKKDKEEKAKTENQLEGSKKKSKKNQDVLASTKEPVKQVEVVTKEDTAQAQLLVEDDPEVKKVEQKPTLSPEKTILDEKPLVETSKKTTPIVSETSVNNSGEFKNYLKWRVGVKAGIGNILDNNFEASNAYGLYQEKLLKGWTFGADIAFFPLEGFGLGLVYTDFKSSNSNESLTYVNQVSGEEVTGSISNKISRKFFGPSLFLRKGIDFKTFVVLGLSPGMYFYSDKGDYNQANFEYTGKEFGGAATLGLDFLLGNDIIGRDIILSLEAGYNMGKINDLNYGDGTGLVTLDNPIIMDRLDFSIGLRFMRFPKYLKK